MCKTKDPEGSEYLCKARSMSGPVQIHASRFPQQQIRNTGSDKKQSAETYEIVEWYSTGLLYRSVRNWKALAVLSHGPKASQAFSPLLDIQWDRSEDYRNKKAEPETSGVVRYAFIFIIHDPKPIPGSRETHLEQDSTFTHSFTPSTASTLTGM